jgi:hypothetical protein
LTANEELVCGAGFTVGSLAGIGAKLRLGSSWIEIGFDKELTDENSCRM